MIIRTGTLRLNSRASSTGKGGDTDSFESMTFDPPFPEKATVVVIPMVQTFNGADTPGVRIADVTPAGFKIRMNELVGPQGKALSDGRHHPETIGWVAISEI